MRIAILLLANLVLAAQALAQTPAPADYEGKWIASWTMPAGGNDAKLTAELVLNGATGTWNWIRQTSQNGRAVCANLAFPITVETVSASELKLHLDESKTVHGCPDHDVVVHLRPDRTLEGRFARGLPIHFARP